MPICLPYNSRRGNHFNEDVDETSCITPALSPVVSIFELDVLQYSRRWYGIRPRLVNSLKIWSNDSERHQFCGKNGCVEDQRGHERRSRRRLSLLDIRPRTCLQQTKNEQKGWGRTWWADRREDLHSWLTWFYP